mgnify:CR=1 FL=1|tara:strand:- start:508 stop:717 length:210 start_codon:yes stop_codon:yes gene_type:complete
MAKGTKTLNHGLAVDDDGNVYIAVMDETPDGADLDDGEIKFYLDQANNKLGVIVAYEDGTIKSHELALT